MRARNEMTDLDLLNQAIEYSSPSSGETYIPTAEMITRQERDEENSPSTRSVDQEELDTAALLSNVSIKIQIANAIEQFQKGFPYAYTNTDRLKDTYEGENGQRYLRHKMIIKSPASLGDKDAATFGQNVVNYLKTKYKIRCFLHVDNIDKLATNENFYSLKNVDKRDIGFIVSPTECAVNDVIVYSTAIGVLIEGHKEINKSKTKNKKQSTNKRKSNEKPSQNKKSKTSYDQSSPELNFPIDPVVVQNDDNPIPTEVQLTAESDEELATLKRSFEEQKQDLSIAQEMYQEATLSKEKAANELKEKKSLYKEKLKQEVESLKSKATFFYQETDKIKKDEQVITMKKNKVDEDIQKLDIRLDQ